MLEFSACIEWLFAEEANFAKRIEIAGHADLNSVEFWTWRDKNLSEISAALQQTGMHVTSFVSEPEGRLVDKTTHDAFLAGVADSAAVAQSLGCDGLIVLAGDTLLNVSRQSQRGAVVEALQRAAPIAAQHDVTLLLEPLNTRIDHFGHFLDSTTEGLDIVEQVSAPNVKLLFDLYHSTVMGERSEDLLNGRMDLVGHVHVADAPGRHEPGTGRIDWRATFSWLRRSEYRGLLGLEYIPSAHTTDSLSRLNRLQSSPGP